MSPASGTCSCHTCNCSGCLDCTPAVELFPDAPADVIAALMSEVA